MQLYKLQNIHKNGERKVHHVGYKIEKLTFSKLYKPNQPFSTLASSGLKQYKNVVLKLNIEYLDF